MDYLQITGGTKLSGSINISGAKNSALPVIAATILSDQMVKLTNLPNVVDIRTLLKLLTMLGGEVNHNNTVATINNKTINSTKAVYEIVSQMRASILVLGPLLARFGECEVSLPGGCAIGQRPIDLHLKALEAMGAKIEIKGGYVRAEALDGLHGAKIVFDKITVGGTENIVMAAALAHGTTTIINAKAVQWLGERNASPLSISSDTIQNFPARNISSMATNSIDLKKITPFFTQGNLIHNVSLSLSNIAGAPGGVGLRVGYKMRRTGYKVTFNPAISIGNIKKENSFTYTDYIWDQKNHRYRV